ncbi:MAG: NADH-quinone oxidoreductase subunit H, partial [Propionibacteriaceae bacterium]
GNLTIFGHMTRLQLWDAPVAVLFMLAVASMGIYGTVLAGWASSDSYSLLGSLRSSASMISYEVAMGLSLVTVFMMSGTMSMSGIVEAQRGTIALGGIDTTLPFRYWLLIPSFVIFTIAALGEANRTPFDFAECEQELVSGHITEYTGFRYALYYLGEYIALTTQSAMIATLFFGSYLTPWPLNFIEFFNNPWFGPLWFLIKSQIVMFCIIWLRGAVPRLRYDQFMKLGWKVLIPVSLLWVMAVAVVKAGVQYGWWQTTAGMIVVGIVIAALLIWAFWPEKKASPAAAHNAPFDAFAGGYPVPPMPGQVLPEFAGVVPGETTTMKEA